jgi:two-component system chemotaxis sensor kinase CheA
MPLDELRRTFLSEAAEMLRTVEILMARQTANPADASLGPGIRRSLHTVKGTCGFLGLPRLEALAHAVEDCLTADGRCRSAPEQALIRSALDRMNRIIARVDGRNGAEPAGQDGELLAALEEASGRASTDLSGMVPDNSRMSWDGERLPGALPERVTDTYASLVSRVPDEHVRKTLSRLAEIAGRLSADVTESGMQPIGEVWPLLARATGELAAAAGRQVFFSTEGGDIVVDREVAQKLFQPLLQLLRNAIAHGIEAPDERRRAGKLVAGHIRLSARQKGSRLIIDMADDGAGIDPEISGSIFTAGFSTQAVATKLAGRGVGLDIVKSGIEAIDGLVGFKSEPGRGTTFTLDVPVTFSGERALARRGAGSAVEVERLVAAGA